MYDGASPSSSGSAPMSMSSSAPSEYDVFSFQLQPRVRLRLRLRRRRLITTVLVLLLIRIGREDLFPVVLVVLHGHGARIGCPWPLAGPSPSPPTGPRPLSGLTERPSSSLSSHRSSRRTALFLPVLRPRAAPVLPLVSLSFLLGLLFVARWECSTRKHIASPSHFCLYF